MSLEKNGYPSLDEIKKCSGYPDDDRLAKGNCIVIECIQEIPCDPCETACKFGAIKIGQPITNLPVLNERLCTGCGNCIADCPGLAIFLLNKAYAPGEALVAFPYEFYPLPEKGEIVMAVDRSGKVIGEGKVIKILNPKKNDRTNVVYLEIPLELADEVRSMKYQGKK
jgi:Fe-S-cluster-containing hydrogenase component 2